MDEKLYTREDLEKAINFGIDLEAQDIERNFKKYATNVDQFIETVLNQQQDDKRRVHKP
jgi:hypothetical protein